MVILEQDQARLTRPKRGFTSLILLGGQYDSECNQFAIRPVGIRQESTIPTTRRLFDRPGENSRTWPAIKCEKLPRPRLPRTVAAENGRSRTKKEEQRQKS